MTGTVIIPVYQATPALSTLVNQMEQAQNAIVVVDDGSGEEDRPLFVRLSQQAVVLHHNHNRGKGAAIKTALRYLVAHDVAGPVAVMDGDGQHLVADTEKVLAAAAVHPEAVILGTRRVGAEMPFRSRWGNSLTSWLFHRITGVRVTDTQTGLRGFDSDFCARFAELPGERYEYEMNQLLVCAREQIPLLQVPIATIYHDRNRGSHFRLVADSALIYRQLLR